MIAKSIAIIYVTIFILLVCIFSCGGNSDDSDDNSVFALLPQESGDDGLCTVTGLNSQFKAGFTRASTETQNVALARINTTRYGVILVKNANIGTVLEITASIDPDIYTSSTCPLNVQTDTAATANTEYTQTNTSGTTITFIKSGSYLVYFYLLNQSDDSASFTAVLSGTPVSTDGASTGATDDLTFNKSCTSSGACSEIYGTETDCLSGETDDTEKCSTDDVLGTCKQPKTDGYRLSLFYNSFVGGSTIATAVCSGLSGTYVSGYSAP
ncbi:hypothetical protein [Leptospira sp. GIMC2001]|uniref:hypothetical protein n=1 Tax=Leptospira sp. GIMC2001 TaxID=1513297 RepID=UPI00234B7357|nr:hypothetical protein [Leptospira sp. GIMC2001]WCL47884.1 hypothetical protein O4O04_11175 [Leptospira sp. GIMC2001]